MALAGRGDVRDWLAGVLIRAGLHLASDSHAFWLWKIQTMYWESVAGRELRRRLGLDEEG